MKTLSFIRFPFNNKRCPANLISKIFCWGSVNFLNSLIF